MARGMAASRGRSVASAVEETAGSATHLTTAARSLQHHVTERLREAIISGQMKPGERLAQDRLSRELGVSSGPVREALRHLENEGLVAYYPNRGCFVMAMDDEELVRVVLPLRSTLEQYAAMCYIERHETPFTDLRALVDEMRAASAEDDLVRLIEADMRFHEALVVGSGRPHTLQLWRGIYSRIRVQLYRLGPAHASGEEIVVEHEELLAALEAKGKRRIAQTLDDHIVGAAVRLLGRESS